MTFFALTFPVFLVVVLAAYYLAPSRFQWMVLLAGSLVFYLWSRPAALIYLAVVGLSSYAAGLLLGRLNARQKSLPRELRAKTVKSIRRKKRAILAVCLVFLFGMLFVVKYWNGMAGLWEGLFGLPEGSLSLKLIIAVGLSFYMFQSAGYVIDCYRGKHPPERNFAKYFLFVSFFPQLIQGPISRFHELGPQLTQPHPWNADNIKYGLQRMLWGYLKKLVLADRAAVVVSTVFGNLDQYGGALSAFAVLFYCIELYCDFSGGIDITIGVAELFGINVVENFKRPIFATSLSDYWRRWHITLGTWMRDYVFYSLSLSRPFAALGRFARRHIRGKAGKVVPTAAATFLVYLIIGIWHGVSFRYIAFGLWNGALMTASVLLAGTYASIKQHLHIDDSARWYRVFQILRTMVIVFVGRYITVSPRLLTAGHLLWKTISSPCLYQLRDGTLLHLGLSVSDYIVVLMGILILLAVEWKQEQGVAIRKTLEQKSIAVQFLFLFLPLLILLFLGILKGSAINAAFIYQQF